MTTTTTATMTAEQHEDILAEALQRAIHMGRTDSAAGRESLSPSQLMLNFCTKLNGYDKAAIIAAYSAGRFRGTDVHIGS